MTVDDTDSIDRSRILERRRQFMLQAMSGAVLAATAGCQPCLSITPRPLLPGGVFVAWVSDRSCTGCAQLSRGDLIQSVDGVGVSTMDELEATGLADGQPHQLTVHAPRERATTTIEFAVTTAGQLPILGVGAIELDRAPEWARHRLFGHASPRLMLIDAESGAALGSRDLLGKRWLLALFDVGTTTDRQHAALTLQVMQKAQADLRARGIGMIFAHVPHLAASATPPMNSEELLGFVELNQLPPREGGPLPLPPLFRPPNRTEFDAERVRGLEDNLHYVERLGDPPSIIVLDERGIIRWHSSGATEDPAGEIALAMVHTINEAVLFALHQL